VRTGGRWLDAREALVRAGSSKGEIHGLATMEDGRRVYAYETSSETGQWAHAFIGELRDGEPAFYRAHLGGSPGDTWMPIKRDTDGCLWAPAQESVDWWSGGWSNRQFAVCIGRAGIEVINGAGWPVLCDLGGNTWLKRTFGQEWSDEFDLRHHDGPGGKVRVPTGDPHTRLMSDGPGSVYAWTDYGLCHMVADAPARPAAFALKEVVIPTGFEGTVMQVTYIQPGAILVETLLPSDAGTGLYVYPRP
jgi:hypothetical protein